MPVLLNWLPIKKLWFVNETQQVVNLLNLTEKNSVIKVSSSGAAKIHSRAPWWLLHLLRCPGIIITLQMEVRDYQNNASSSLEVSLRLSQSMSCVKTAPVMEKKTPHFWWGRGDPKCSQSREVCCLPRAWVTDVKNTSYPGTALRLLSIIDVSGKQW